MRIAQRDDIRAWQRVTIELVHDIGVVRGLALEVLQDLVLVAEIDRRDVTRVVLEGLEVVVETRYLLVGRLIGDVETNVDLVLERRGEVAIMIEMMMVTPIMRSDRKMVTIPPMVVPRLRRELTTDSLRK